MKSLIGDKQAAT